MLISCFLVFGIRLCAKGASGTGKKDIRKVMKAWKIDLLLCSRCFNDLCKPP